MPAQALFGITVASSPPNETIVALSYSSIRFRERSTQPNAQSDTLVVACRVNARERRLVAMW
jgi:hypothetical protein